MKINFLMLLAILQILIITACNSVGEQRNSASIDTTKDVQIQPETFYNFIYDFMFKEEIQAERAKVQGWKFKNYFEGYDYTTHFLNSFEIPDNEFNSDISAKKYLSAINLNSRTKEVFTFEKSGDKWFLTNYISYEFNTDSVTDFETFLFHFSKDSAYRMEHIQFPLKHGALNDEEDYSDTIIYLVAPYELKNKIVLQSFEKKKENSWRSSSFNFSIFFFKFQPIAANIALILGEALPCK